MNCGQNLSLPRNIPWKHLATSEDMMDTSFGDRSYPLKWKSSLAIFHYQPELDDKDDYPESTITYLKVVCSITGYQVDSKELGVKVDKPKEWDTRVWRNFNKLIRDYYPCYGALLQVAVFPGRDSDVQLSTYPYFIDFEPKKREMYEIVTETGEMLSRSISTTKVGKNSTTAESLETVDIDKGWQAGVEAKKAGTGGKAEIGVSHETGYRAGSRSEDVNIRSIDDSREKRESFSHTTKLTQMYHLLDSYHLGTNRALFAIFPRPHIVDVDFSVTNGMRRLEGIQEFLLVVEQPKDVKKLCVEAHLETSHLHKSTRTKTTGKTRHNCGSIKQRIADSSGSDTKRSYKIPVPDSLKNKVDRSRGNGGYEEKIVYGDDLYEDIDSHSVRVFDDHILVEVTYNPSFVIGDWAYFTADYTVYYISREPVEKPTTTSVEEVNLYMTGRYLANCLKAGEDEKWIPDPYKIPMIQIHGDYVTFEETLPFKYWGVASDAPYFKPEDAAKRTVLTNELGRYMKDRVVASIHSPDRYAIGEQTFLETDFATRFLFHSTEDIGLAPETYEKNVEIPESLSKKLNVQDLERLAATSVAELLQTSTADIARMMSVTNRDIVNMKLANLGVPLEQSEPDNHKVTVPDVVGKLLTEARKVLKEKQLEVADVAYQDSLKPKDTTLNQYHNTGTSLEKGKVVNLVVSSGPVSVPDVVGLQVDEATAKLKELSLHVEQTYAVSDEQSEGHVLETTPEANTKVPQNSEVVILVAKKKTSRS